MECEHELDDSAFLPHLSDSKRQVYKCKQCKKILVCEYCHPCSVSGDAGKPIYHSPPVCP